MTADEPVAGVPRLCARRADCTRPRGHDDECGPDRADTELSDLRAEVERLREDGLSLTSRKIMARVVESVSHDLTARLRRVESERDALQRRVDAGLALAVAWQAGSGPSCSCGHGLDEHNGLGCYARLSYFPLVTCACTLTDDRAHGLIAAEELRAALDAVEPADQPRFGPGCAACNYSGAVGTLADPHPCHDCAPADQPHPTPEAHEHGDAKVWAASVRAARQREAGS